MMWALWVSLTFNILLVAIVFIIEGDRRFWINAYDKKAREHFKIFKPKDYK